MHPQRPLLAAFLSVTVALILTGCSSRFDPAASGPVTIPGVALSGTSFGGRQPVAGAHVYVMRANHSSYAGPGIAPVAGNLSNSLLTTGSGSDSVGEYVLTDANGKFSVSSDYACTAGDQIYLLSLGGKPDGTNNNTAIGLMAILGTCGTDFSSSTTVNMNEVSTVAAAYAMAGFASDATHVGTSGSALALTGIKNAFHTANQLYDISTNPYSAPNTSARTAIPNEANGGTGTVPQQQIDTLADILAMCVNTTSSGSTQCTTLFTNGKTASVTPTDTATVAILMAQNPSNTSVYNVSGTPPFTPYFNTAPANLTILLTFTGGGLNPGLGQQEGIVVDPTGNIWAAGVYGDFTGSSGGTTLSEFSPLGIPVVAGGITTLGLSYPNALAFDSTSSTLYITNSGNDSLVKYTVSGGAHTSFSTGPSGALDVAVAVDSAGDPWVANTTTAPWVQRFNSSGTLVTTPTGNGLNGSNMIAFSAGSLGNVWVANNGDSNISLFTNAGAAVTTTVIGQNDGVVIDASGNAWFSDMYNGTTKVNSSGGSPVFHGFTGLTGTASTSAIVLDGAGNVWSANDSFNSGVNTDNAICALNNSAANISGAHGYPPPTATTQPNAIAVDLSGNVWYDTGTDNKLYELVGIAVPVANPVAYAAANSKLGARP
ncbi:MAG: hypothetical protein V4555_09890 [Acidobacteriota bacterium]